jgi:predicted alpha/beta superfamily hydrolase
LQHTLTGNIHIHRGFHSTNLPTDRDVIVYLPPGYNDDPSRRFPVLYFNDGQNLFDRATAFLGNEWGLDETAEGMIEQGAIQPLIMVGIYNVGVRRIGEYTPVRDHRGRGGLARRYGRLLVDELKPFIDRHYRTSQNPSDTGLGGSSLGGLVTLYLGLEYWEVFGKLAVMSPSVWWGDRDILYRVQKLRGHLPLRIWLDVGTAEGKYPQRIEQDVEDLCQILISKGWRLGEDLVYHVDAGAGHNELAWGQRAPEALKFLFPAG